MGALIFDGFCDGILIYNHGESITDIKIDETASESYRQDASVPQRLNIFLVRVADVHCITWKVPSHASRQQPLI